MHQWSNEEVEKAWSEWRNRPSGEEGDAMNTAMRRVMSLAVELVATRGCGAIELPDGFEDVLREMESRGSKREAQAAVTVRGLLASHAAQRAQVATLQAKVAEMAREEAGERASAENAHAEVERLKAERSQEMKARGALLARLTSAESRLAAIREKETARAVVAVTNLAEDVVYNRVPAAALNAGQACAWLSREACKRLGWERSTAEARAVLEGEAPQEAKAVLYNVTDHGGTLVIGERGITTLDGRPPRYPCSPTCTHDDAANPGHPERVKERSEAVLAMHPNGSCECCGEGLCSWCRQAERQATLDEGAEAMRAECLVQVVALLNKYGISVASPMREELVAAIEGATP